MRLSSLFLFSACGLRGSISVVWPLGGSLRLQAVPPWGMALRFAPVGRRPEWSIRQGQRRIGFADFRRDVCRKRRDLDIATVERECNGSLLGAQAGPLIFAGAISGMTMKLVEGRVVQALASRRDVKNPSSGAAGRGARCVSQSGQRLFARPLLLFRSAGLLLLGVRLWLAVLRLVRWLWFLWGGHEFHSLFKCCQPGHSVRRGNRQLGLSLWTVQTSCRRGQRQRRLRIFGGIPPAALIRYLRNCRRKQWGLKPRPGEIFDRISARPKAGQSGR